MLSNEKTPLYRTHPDHRAYHLYHIWPVTCLLTLLSIIFLIVALYEPHIYTRRPINAVDAVINTGAFSLCVNAKDGSGTITFNQCWDIDKRCQTPQPWPSILPDTFKGQVVNDCDRFNAARGALIAAVVFTGVGLITQLLATSRLCIMSNAALSFAFTMLGALAGMVAMALFATLHNSDDAIPVFGSTYDYCFWLLVAGWSVAFVCSLFYIPLLASVPTPNEPLLPEGSTTTVI